MSLFGIIASGISGHLTLPSYTDDFSADNWSDIGSLIAVNTGTGVMDWDGTRVVDHGSHLDLQTAEPNGIGKNASDTSWVLRFKLTTDTVTQAGSGAGEIISWGLSKDDKNSEGTIGQEHIVLSAFVAVTNKKYNSTVNETADMLTNMQAFVHEPSVETIYVEIIRVSATVVTMELFSNSSYTTSIEIETDGASSTINDLRYIRVTGFDALDPAAGNVYQGTLDDLAFYDGVTSAP